MENQKCRRHTLSSVPDITKASWIMNPEPFLACGELHGWCEQLIHTKTCFPANSAKSNGRARLTCTTATGLQKFDHPEADPSPPGGGTPAQSIIVRNGTRVGLRTLLCRQFRHVNQLLMGIKGGGHVAFISLGRPVGEHPPAPSPPRAAARAAIVPEYIV